MTQAVNELNGKLINGCCILVKPLKENSPVSQESKPANVIREEKLPGVAISINAARNFRVHWHLAKGLMNRAHEHHCNAKYLSVVSPRT